MIYSQQSNLYHKAAFFNLKEFKFYVHIIWIYVTYTCNAYQQCLGIDIFKEIKRVEAE